MVLKYCLVIALSYFIILRQQIKIAIFKDNLFEITLKFVYNYQYKNNLLNKSIMFDNIVICPWQHGQRRNGVDNGAYEIKNLIQEHYINTNTNTNIVDITQNDTNTEVYNKKIFDICSLQYGSRLTIGGDHSIGVGSVLSSLQHNPDTCVIWIDAHPDINTMITSSSKNVHGMPLSFLTGLENSWKWVNNKPILKFNNLCYFGIRDCDDFEINLIKRKNIHVFTNVDDITQTMKLHKFKNFHISFDVDSLDPMYMPSTGTRSDNGVELEEIEYLFNYIKTQNKNVNVDIVEYNPLIGSDEEKQISKQTINRLLKSIL
jgi:arginase